MPTKPKSPGSSQKSNTAAEPKAAAPAAPGAQPDAKAKVAPETRVLVRVTGQPVGEPSGVHYKGDEFLCPLERAHSLGKLVQIIDVPVGRQAAHEKILAAAKAAAAKAVAKA